VNSGHLVPRERSGVFSQPNVAGRQLGPSLAVAATSNRRSRQRGVFGCTRGVPWVHQLLVASESAHSSPPLLSPILSRPSSPGVRGKQPRAPAASQRCSLARPAAAAAAAASPSLRRRTSPSPSPRGGSLVPTAIGLELPQGVASGGDALPELQYLSGLNGAALNADEKKFPSMQEALGKIPKHCFEKVGLPR